MRQALGREQIPRWLTAIETRLLDNETQAYFVGTQMTVADLAIWRLIAWFTSGILDGVPTDLVDKHPALKAHHAAIDADPRIRAWMESHYPSK